MKEKFLIGISYVSQIEFLRRAVKSLGKYREQLYVIDSSVPPDPQPLLEDNCPCGIRQMVPLSATQSVNYIFALGEHLSKDYAIVMHADAEASEETIAKLTEIAEKLDVANRKWSVIFTQYDVVALYNLAVPREILWWGTEFPSYRSDCDAYYRYKLAGYELIESGLMVIHFGSHIIKSDHRRSKLNDLLGPFWKEMYLAKWGGDGGFETFTKPYNGQLENL